MSKYLIPILMMASTLSFAQPTMMKNDPKRPIDKISKDLGITQDEFVTCFNDVNPSPQGKKPTKQRERMNKSVLLPCLQKVNSSISNNKLDSVMDKYRP